ncbi:type III toxin-antitoxin system ToxN/AbiQ family toxin [Anaerocolumna aminovalerica]|uniref:type III toxin-antitoxin system ToxN/AbiQ family toxin n=1 Tax=Anaerocolumna aminovalerica TaxID=1527 RepID=UPI001C0EAB2E|nr:type III toxin-antitoxin system ToxN/AbiQ family toxin [Anaerocolumna aminovalerica]MBU5332115.1 type III toxin-antitoxin system ToxN/AbiQ family toxin [Anaerocolumna aminovalerica]
MLKFYDIDKDYVKFLQSYDRQVPNIEYSTNNKFVCGVVLHINNLDYYAPISHMTDKQQTNLQIFDNNKPISTIRFSFMIPAYSDVLIVKNFKEIANVNQSYSDLLNAEYKYCVKHEDDILKKALSVYKIGCNKNHRLNYTCCKFKLLEEVCELYKVRQEVATTKEIVEE